MAENVIMEENKDKTERNPDGTFKYFISRNGGRHKQSALTRQILLDAAPEAAQVLVEEAKNKNIKVCLDIVNKFVPDVQSVVLDDNREEDEEDMSQYTDEQLRKIAEKEKEIQNIKNGGGPGHENPGA